ncbi:hypothetical protein CY0110_18267 [Crocosphaera chwakensis CCY0110]|uniref:Uncharacterized protein n=1 Tax=Crocosphaera chwakensis CCY0110 TaxID=391612 RepID=A3IIY5_9CHRO|nr:hypothetical protein CY0110_18267 [Crocosphaera chwakensis CCY0110]
MRSRVLPEGAFLAKNSIIFLATSIPDAFSIPSIPGEELTSITTGP